MLFLFLLIKYNLRVLYCPKLIMLLNTGFRTESTFQSLSIYFTRHITKEKRNMGIDYMINTQIIIFHNILSKFTNHKTFFFHPLSNKRCFIGCGQRKQRKWEIYIRIYYEKLRTYHQLIFFSTRSYKKSFSLWLLYTFRQVLVENIFIMPKNCVLFFCFISILPFLFDNN